MSHKVIYTKKLCHQNFSDELDRAGLQIPTLNIVFLVHSAIHLYRKLANYSPF